MPALMRQKGARRELVLSSPTHSVIVSAAWLNLVKAPLRGREVALSSRGTWRSRLFRDGKRTKARLPRCARNDKTMARSDLGCSGMVNREKRDCDAGNSVNAPLRGREVALSSRGTKRSRLFRAGKQQKERLLRRLASICHREARSDLAFPELANR